MARFRRYIGIDYSGAGEPDEGLKGIQVYCAESGPPERIPPSDGRDWSRCGLADWLVETMRTDVLTIAGIDHAFSFPMAYMKKYGLSSWRKFLQDFSHYWPTDRNRVRDLRQDNQRTGDKEWLRMTDMWSSSAKSVFDFRGPSVASSTHAGLPLLLRLVEELHESVHFWPFMDFNVPAGKSVIAEVYPSVFRRRYEREIRDEFGEGGARKKRSDEVDAYAVARWLQDRDALGFLDRYLEPALSEAEKTDAQREGWILGIG